jgi:hypothetical protein
MARTLMAKFEPKVPNLGDPLFLAFEGPQMSFLEDYRDDHRRIHSDFTKPWAIVHLPWLVVVCAKEGRRINGEGHRSLAWYPRRHYHLRMFGPLASFTTETSYPQLKWYTEPPIADVVIVEESVSTPENRRFLFVFTATKSEFFEHFPGWYCRVRRRSSDGKYAFVEKGTEPTGPSDPESWFWTLEDILTEWIMNRIHKYDFVMALKHDERRAPRSMLEEAALSVMNDRRLAAEEMGLA